MLQQHAGMETTAESSTKEVCRRELHNYLEYVWRPADHERRVSPEEWWHRRECLWPWVATIARRRLATRASSGCSERSFLKAGLICLRKWMISKPEHVGALSLLGWHAMLEKELLSKGNRFVGHAEEMYDVRCHGLNSLVGSVC